MKTIGDVILGTIEDLIAHKIIPEYPCRKCRINYVFNPDDFCDKCIEKMIEEEG